MALTIKQEKFCRVYLETSNATEAYRQSYDCQNMKPESINRKAKELTDNGKIAARMKELQEELANRNKVTVDSLLDELNEARNIALSALIPQASAAVSATMSKAKLLGMIIDKASLKISPKSISDLDDDELEAIAAGRSN